MGLEILLRSGWMICFALMLPKTLILWKLDVHILIHAISTMLTGIHCSLIINQVRSFWESSCQYSYHPITRTHQMIYCCFQMHQHIRFLSFLDPLMRMINHYLTFYVQSRCASRVTSASKAYRRIWNVESDLQEIWFHGQFQNSSKMIHLQHWMELELSELQHILMPKIKAMELEH